MKKIVLVFVTFLTFATAASAQDWMSIADKVLVVAHDWNGTAVYPEYYTSIEQTEGQNAFRIENFMGSGITFEFELDSLSATYNFDAEDITSCRGYIKPVKGGYVVGEDMWGDIYNYCYISADGTTPASGFSLPDTKETLDAVKIWSDMGGFAANFGDLDNAPTGRNVIKVDDKSYEYQGYITALTYTKPQGGEFGSPVYIDFYCYFEQMTEGIQELKGTAKNSTPVDLLGRSVTAPVKGGLYIQNGKKFIAE